MELKAEILNRYKQLVADRIDVYRDRIAALTIDAQSDAKGSAGDKHETTLSMMHLEQEKLSIKLREALEQQEALSRIQLAQRDTAGAGSLIKSGNFNFFISTALPKITVEHQFVFALSPQSPLGAALLGKKCGDEVQVQGKTYRIDEIL